MVFAELATIVAGCHENQSRLSTGGSQSRPHRLLDDVKRQAIDDEFVDALTFGGEIGFGLCAERGAMSVAGARAE